jgi:hypothetical protein
METKKNPFYENGFWWWWDEEKKDWLIGPSPSLSPPIPKAILEKKMTASANTIEEVLKVVLKYVPEENINPLLEELSSIPGNKSFLEMVQILQQKYQEERKIDDPSNLGKSN